MVICEECKKKHAEKRCKVCGRNLCFKCFHSDGDICAVCLYEIDDGDLN